MVTNELIINGLEYKKQSLKFTIFTNNMSIGIYDNITFDDLGDDTLTYINSKILIQPKIKLVFFDDSNFIHVIENNKNNPFFYLLNFEPNRCVIKEIT